MLQCPLEQKQELMSTETDLGAMFLIMKRATTIDLLSNLSGNLNCTLLDISETYTENNTFEYEELYNSMETEQECGLCSCYTDLSTL
ncbi:DNA mismatch repair protein Msh2 [Dissostichus eleginoides]|uniref:DNA mismatch repair protein Msh2 n=1 Tax=Dissostichus eleginoides TaxID=100907 RepID=A0AAD9FF08_DISEL|nr:DNA mismatch repair protein Msh2 [Dissostichus eleginoides]